MDLHPDLYKDVALRTPQDPFFERWGRRVLVYGGYFVACILTTATLPIWLAVAIVVDLFKRENWITLRVALFFWVYFCFEVYAILALFAQWLVSGIWMGLNRRRFQLWDYRLQRWWIGNIMRVLFRVFDANIVVEGDHDLRKNKFILFMRHSSSADTLFGPYFAFAQGVSLRVIVKRGLLFDAAIETSFNRLPNVFVRRDGVDSAAQIEAVGSLMDDFGPSEGILMYPEGTRYTEAKKQRVIEKLRAAGNDAGVARAEALKRSLPPRPGGPLKLLEKNKDADVIFLTHVGLEDSTGLRDMWNGGLVGKTVRFKFWRVPFEQIPKTPEEQTAWLYENWLKVDAFVVEHLGDSAAKSEQVNERAAAG